MTPTADADSVRVVLRLRTLSPAGLNPPQTEVLDRLRTLTEEKDMPVTELDVDVWGTSMGITQTERRDPAETHETVAEFKQWADKHGYTLQPAFEWRAAESGEDEETQILPPLITLAVYSGEHLQVVYPHVDDEDVWTVYDGIEALVSRAADAEQVEDERSENRAVPLP